MALAGWRSLKMSWLAPAENMQSKMLAYQITSNNGVAKWLRMKAVIVKAREAAILMPAIACRRKPGWHRRGYAAAISASATSAQQSAAAAHRLRRQPAAACNLGLHHRISQPGYAAS